MKKTLALFLALLLMLSLCSCGGESGNKKKDVPSNKLIAQDLGNALKAENPHATLKSSELIKSLSEDGKYMITMSVTAETKYADWTYEADLSYTKYDQGWVVDRVNWKKSSYVVARQPAAKDIAILANQASDLKYKHYNLDDNQFVSDATIKDFAPKNETLLYYWNLVEQRRHVDHVGYYNSAWKYNASQDSWTFQNYDRYDYDLKPHDVNLNGTWTSQYYTYTVVISDFTWTGFNLKIDGKNYGHFSGSDTTFYSSLDSNIYCYLDYKDNSTSITCNRVSGNFYSLLGYAEITK